MKRKWFAIGIILFFVGVTIAPTIAQDIEKSQPTSRGNWLYVGGDGPGNYTMIQDAIDNASAGDTVFVFDDSSPYYENINITKVITLKGQNQYTTIIDGRGITDVIYITADYSTITGFSIRNGENPRSENEVAGIKVYAKYVVIHNNTITNNYFGITIQVSLITAKSYLSVLNNNISNNLNAGIFLPTRYNTVSGNVISNNSYGIHLLQESDFNTITFNIITTNDNGLILEESTSNIIQNNIITNNGDYGILLRYEDVIGEGKSYRDTANQNNISKNFISGHTYGIFIQLECNENRIYRNNISGNTWGLYSDISKNSVEENNFLENSRNAFFKKFRLYTVQFYHNYWDDWQGENWKVITGKVALFHYFTFSHHFEYFWFFLPCKGYDKYPAPEPYDIPGMS
jgi:parallel beta-helix repeat protein